MPGYFSIVFYSMCDILKYINKKSIVYNIYAYAFIRQLIIIIFPSHLQQKLEQRVFPLEDGNLVVTVKFENINYPNVHIDQ